MCEKIDTLHQQRSVITTFPGLLATYANNPWQYFNALYPLSLSSNSTSSSLNSILFMQPSLTLNKSIGPFALIPFKVTNPLIPYMASFHGYGLVKEMLADTQAG